MATPDPSEVQPGSQQSNSVQSFLSRDRLARLVVMGSFLTLFLMVSALLYLAALGTNQKAIDVADKAFTTILPVLAGWVGTVLAYFFSAQNLERTSASLDKAMDQASGTPPTPPSTPIYGKMIKLEDIKKLQDLSGKKLTDFPLTDLQQAFKGAEPDPPASRLLFLLDKKFRYIMHSSVLNAFLVSHTQPNLTLQDIADDPESLRQISRMVAFVSGSATLADAKAAMDAVAGAQDIIVTTTGDANGDVIGWLSNVDLVKALS
jgi:hypothetical protein